MGNFIKVISLITFLIMITINVLANTIPINGVTTGEVSDSFPNLFAPAAFTFAIWGLIYLLLAGYTIYQLGFFKGNANRNSNLLRKIGIYFSVSSIANAIWIIAWHNYYIGITVILMLLILICLIAIILEIQKEKLTLKEKLFVQLPFGVYFGWITVATIANITTFLVSIDWDGFGISEPVWTIIIIIVGFLLGTLTMLRNKDIPYGLVIIWAYVGILVKHISKEGFAGEYPEIIATVSICIGFLLVTVIYLFVKRK